MRILFAEDDKYIAEVVKATLENLGKYEVCWVDTGKKAYELAKAEDHDLVLLDDMMPGINGQEVCRRLRQENDTRPIVLLSARAREGMDCGASKYLQKPFEPQQLFQQIRQVLEER